MKANYKQRINRYFIIYINDLDVGIYNESALRLKIKYLEHQEKYEECAGILKAIKIKERENHLHKASKC